MDRIGDRGALEAFVRSVDLGGFSAAARDLKLSPSALSKLVSRLESNLRVRLLHRTTRRLSPTAEGELFLARCRRILQEFEDAENEVGCSRERPRGRLRMHVAVGFAIHQVLPALPRFVERYPDVALELLLEDRDVGLLREEVDISVRPGPPSDTSLVARKLFEFERVVCASPAYLALHGTPLAPEDLARHRCITLTGFAGRMPWSLTAAQGLSRAEHGAVLRCNNADAALRLALLGVGVVRLNEFVVAHALHCSELVPLLPDHRDAAGTMLALYPQERHRLPRVAAMLDFLVSEFAGRPWRVPPAAPARRSARSRPRPR